MAEINNYKFLILLVSVFHFPITTDNTAVTAGVAIVAVGLPTAHWLLSKSQPVQKWILNLIKCMTQAEFVPRDLIMNERTLKRLDQLVLSKKKFLNCGILTFVVCGPIHQIRWALNFALLIVRFPRAFGRTVVSPITCTLRMVCTLFKTCLRRHEKLLVNFAKEINDQQFLSNPNDPGYVPNVDELPKDKFLIPFLTKMDLSFLSKNTPKFPNSMYPSNGLGQNSPRFPFTSSLLKKPLGLLGKLTKNPNLMNIDSSPQFPNGGIQFPNGMPNPNGVIQFPNGRPGVNIFPPQNPQLPHQLIVNQNPPQHPSVIFQQNPPNVIQPQPSSIYIEHNPPPQHPSVVQQNPPLIINQNPPSQPQTVIVEENPSILLPPQNPSVVVNQNPPNVYQHVIVEEEPPKNIIIYSDDEPIIRHPSDISIHAGPMQVSPLHQM